MEKSQIIKIVLGEGLAQSVMQKRTKEIIKALKADNIQNNWRENIKESQYINPTLQHYYRNKIDYYMDTNLSYEEIQALYEEPTEVIIEKIKKYADGRPFYYRIKSKKSYQQKQENRKKIGDFLGLTIIAKDTEDAFLLGKKIANEYLSIKEIGRFFNYYDLGITTRKDHMGRAKRPIKGISFFPIQESNKGEKISYELKILTPLQIINDELTHSYYKLGENLPENIMRTTELINFNEIAKKKSLKDMLLSSNRNQDKNQTNNQI